jgi:hypothetical protein
MHTRTQPFCDGNRDHKKNHVMQKFIYLFLFFAFVQSCKNEVQPPLPPNTIQIEGQDWKYSASCGLLQTAGFPSWTYIYVKVDGEDGSSLYLSLPDTAFEGSNVATGVAYYLASSVNSIQYQTDKSNSSGAVELLAIDTANKTLNLRINVTLHDTDHEIEIVSGDIQNISYNNVSGSMTYLDAAVEKNHQIWNISEYGADMIGGQVNWFFYSRDTPQGEQINFNIPWSAAIGSYQLTPADGKVIFFPEHSSLSSWKLKSGQINIEENDFCGGKMNGTFQAVFQTQDNAVPQIEFTNVRFGVSYAY